MRQHGSFEARAAHNKSHHRRAMHDARGRRKSSRRTPERHDDFRGSLEQDRPDRKWRGRIACSAKTVRLFGERNGFWLTDRRIREGETLHTHDRQRSPELVSNCVSPRRVVCRRSFPWRWLRSFVRLPCFSSNERKRERERGASETFIAALRQGPRRRQSIAPHVAVPFDEFYALASFRSETVAEFISFLFASFSAACSNLAAAQLVSFPRDSTLELE